MVPTGVPGGGGGLGSQFLFNAYRSLLEGGTVPEHFAESGIVFIPKTSDIDDNGRIIRSPDALRPLTLCNCDCKLLTSAICRGLHRYTMRCIQPPSARRELSRTTCKVVGTMVAPQDSFSKLQAFRIHLCTEQSFVTSAATRTVQVFGRNVRNALHQPGHHRVLTQTVTVQLALQSQQMYSEQTNEQFLSFCDRAIIFRLM